MKVGLDDLVGTLVGIGDVAWQLGRIEALFVRSETKRDRLLVSWLDLHLAKIYRLRVYSGTRTSLESAKGKSQLFE